MIKELEIRNTVESVKLGSAYPPYTTDPEVPMISGYVSDSGQLMTVDINREIANRRVRQVYCYFLKVNQSYRQVEYHKVAESDFLFDPVYYNDPGGITYLSSHDFDISSVLTLPREVSVIPVTNEIIIELFTYEANITDATGTAIYGTKRLSVPYDATMDVSQSFPLSTDGIYPLGLVDYAVKNTNDVNSTSFLKNDIVYWFTGDTVPTITQLESGALYKCLETTTSSPDTVDKWELATESDILRYFLIPPAASTTESSTIVGANGLISRYAKQTYLRDVLTRLAYKKHDDISGIYASNVLSTLRELAVHYLEEGSLTRSLFYLDRIVDEYNAYFSAENNITQTNVNIQYTI